MAVTDADVQAIAREVFIGREPAMAEIGGLESDG
jgi:actin-like ATPase involved in cell morphogenesis